MTRAELILRIADLDPGLDLRDVERIVASVFDEVGSALMPAKLNAEIPRKTVPHLRIGKHLQIRLRSA